MDSEAVIIRDLRSEDIPDAMEFVLDEGWNQTENDWLLFIENPLNVCKAAEINGKLVGTIASMNYSGKKVWVSMVLVHKDYRGKGISRLLLDAALNELSSCNSIKLDATDAGLAGYRKFGFYDEYRVLEVVNISFQGLPEEDDDNKPQLIRKEDIPEIIEFDKLAFGADRSGLIEYLINNFPKKSFLLKKNEKMTGYALGRQGNKYHRIGPVSSVSSKDAKILIRHALENLYREPIVIDILDEKRELTVWLSSLGFTEKRYFTRMYQYNNPHPGRRDLLHVIAGPEFG